MAKIIYYCDLHQGGVVEPQDETDVLIHGPHAWEMNQAILNYAITSKADKTICGGDESSHHREGEKHRQRANTIAQMMQSHQGSLERVIGNHDPIDYLEKLGFNTKSFRSDISVRNKILICQPSIDKIDGKTRYFYDPKNILRYIKDLRPSSNNLIVAGHWAFDRMDRGYPGWYSKENSAYGYLDQSINFIGAFQAIANGNTGRVVFLHGHEHRFSMTVINGCICMIMPSPMQADIDDPSKPCGLFAEIEDNGPDGKLTIRFKKVCLNVENPENSEIKTVDMNYMKRYERPVILP